MTFQNPKDMFVARVNVFTVDLPAVDQGDGAFLVRLVDGLATIYKDKGLWKYTKTLPGPEGKRLTKKMIQPPEGA